ncbi:MAG: oligosaccharide flippase family protein [Chloroflexi bacterium]|nr:oligosaccharide flippase family protein [Chloroflexota bacterium]
MAQINTKALLMYNLDPMIHLDFNKRKLTLTQRALLTLVGNMLVQIAEFLTGFFVTPFIIRGLGQELYGAWGMLQQLLGYFSLTEFRATGSLRFLLGLQQHYNNNDEKQRLVGSTLIVWGMSLPVTIAFSIGLLWFLPDIIHVSSSSITGIRVALIILIVNALLDRVLAIPMHILKAQNMDYAGMGINTTMVIMASLLSGIAIWLGWGLPGLAAATMANVLLISIGRFWVARRIIPWMAIKKPNRDEFTHFLNTSGLFFLAGLASLLLYSTDTLLVGAIIGPSVAASYTTSGAVLRMIGEPLFQFVGAGNAGLVGLCGEKDWERVANVRKEMYFILFFFMAILGSGVIALNGAFLKLWLGAEFYGGSLLTIFLVLSLTATFLARIDFTISNAMLYLREQTWALLTAGSVGLGSGLFFLRIFGVGGMAIGMAIGNLVLLTIAWILIQRQMPAASTTLIKSLFRPSFTIISLFGLAFFLQPYIEVPNWGVFFLYGLGIGGFSFIASWFLVLSKEIRKVLFIRAQHNIPFLNK